MSSGEFQQRRRVPRSPEAVLDLPAPHWEPVLHVVLDSMVQGVVAVTASGSIAFVNKRTEALFGYGRSELIGQPVEILLPARYHEVHQRHFSSYLSNRVDRREMTFGRVVTAQRKDGSEFPVEISLNAAGEVDGQIAAIAIISDVSGPERLRKERDVFFRVTPGLLATFSATGELESVNPAFEQTLGWNASDLQGSLLRIIHPEDRLQVGQLLQQFLAGANDPHAACTCRTTCKDGAIRWVNWAVHTSSQGLRIAAGRDITRAKLLALEHRKLAEVVNRSPIFIALISADEQKTIRYVNAAGRELLGADEHEDLAHLDLQTLCGLDSATVEQAAAGLQQSGKWAAEAVFRHRTTAEPILVDAQMVTIFSPEDASERIAFAVFARDIRHCKWAEEEARASAASLHRLIDLAPVEMAMFDTQMRFLALSKAMRDRYGVADAVKGRCLYDLMPNLPSHWRAVHQACLRGAAESHPGEWFTRQDGQRRLVKWQVRPWCHNDGSIGGLVIFSEDITESRQAQQLLIDSEQRFRALVDQAADALLVCDSAGHMTDVNRIACELLGYTRQEMLAKNLFDLIPVQRDELQRLCDGLEAGAPTTAAGLIRRKDGSTFASESRIGLCTLGQGRSYLAMVRDVTERLRDEERLRALTAQLLNAREEERRKIALELHDEFTQKLAAIGFELDLLRGQNDRTSLIDSIRRRVESLTEQMRVVSHEYHPGMLEHAGLETAAQAHCEEVSRHSGIRISLQVRDLPENLPISLSLTLYRILQEALQNVTRHSGADAAHVFLTGYADPPRVTLAVVDHGRGFLIEKVRDGSGLGLLSIEERTRLVQGIMRISSIPGEGTRLEIEIPLPEEPAT